MKQAYAQTTAHAHPWYKNHLFWGTVGSGILTVIDKQTHAGFPVTGAAAVTVGLGLAFGIHTIIMDVHHKALATKDPMLEAMSSIADKVISFITAKEAFAIQERRAQAELKAQEAQKSATQPASTTTPQG